MKEPIVNLLGTLELTSFKPFSQCTDAELIRVAALPDTQHLSGGDDKGVPTTAIGGIRRAIAAGMLMYRNSI